MVRIRLRRVGAKNQPSYRIVVTDSRSPRDGRFIEKIGFYNPRTQPATLELDEARALYWLSNGAQPSEAVQRIITWMGTQERLQRLRAGEELEALVSEAEAELATRETVDPRTRRDDIKPAPKKKAAVEEVEAEAEAAVEAVEEAVAEAVEEIEAEAEEAAEAVEEAVEEGEAEVEETAEAVEEAEAETEETVAEVEEAAEDAAEAVEAEAEEAAEAVEEAVGEVEEEVEEAVAEADAEADADADDEASEEEEESEDE